MLAYDIGVGLVDLEMVQFHPTVYSDTRTAVISEATLGEGAKLINSAGDTLTNSAGLSRAQLAAEVYKVGRNGSGPVSLDLRSVENLVSRFPGAAEVVKMMAGIDITKNPVPVQPVAHRPMGGIETNAAGETSVAGLFAVGECAHNGLNGASRLPGNTLTEAVVFGKRIGEAAATYAKSEGPQVAVGSQVAQDDKRLAEITSGGPSSDTIGAIHRELGELMTANVGVVRADAGLAEAQDKIHSLQQRHAALRVSNTSRIYNYALMGYIELGNLLKLAEATALAARERTESRGAHIRSDHPEQDDSTWKAHTVVRLQDGSPKLATRSVST
jgi:succinate dehydrogenase/fumarate reductase flavoprotein subunit